MNTNSSTIGTCEYCIKKWKECRTFNVEGCRGSVVSWKTCYPCYKLFTSVIPLSQNNGWLQFEEEKEKN